MGFVFFFFFPPSSSIFIVLLNPVKGDCETTIKQGLLYSGLLGRGFDHQLCCRCVALPVIGGISEIIFSRRQAKGQLVASWKVCIMASLLVPNALSTTPLSGTRVSRFLSSLCF